MPLKLVTAPTTQPVSTTEMKDYLRVDVATDDSFIKSLLKAATRKCETLTEKTFMTTTWDLWQDNFLATDSRKEPWWDGTRSGSISALYGHRDQILLQRGPLISVTSITTYGIDDTGTLFPSSNYFVDTAKRDGRIKLNDGAIWPANLRDHNAIQTRYVAGFGSARSDVPDEIKTAIKQYVAFMYEHRGDCTAGNTPDIIRDLLSEYITLSV